MRPAPLLLLVPLVLASLGFSAMAPQTPSSAHVWRQSQKTDAARGITYTQFTLTGKFPKPPQPEVTNRPALVVDCAPNKRSRESKFASAELLVGVPLKIDYVEPSEIRGTSYYPKVAVRYRVDDAKEEQENWDPGTDKASTSLSKDVLKKILRAHTLQITASDDKGSPIVMQFDMPDSKPVETSCHLNDSKKK